MSGRRAGRALVLALALGGCASEALKLAPQSPSEPWTPGENEGLAILPGVGASEVRQGGGSRDFSAPANPAAARLQPPPQIVAGRTYDLPALIDIAARNNPQTRISWEMARQAALAVGISEAAFLPMLSANVIGGIQEVTTPLPDDLTFTTTSNAVIPALALEWLVFDFGERRANADLARHNSFAANIDFTAAHQQVIYAVTVAYYRYGATQSNLVAAERTLANARRIDAAAKARMDRGIGTSVEVAQANQQVAQAKLRLVEAEGARRDAYQGLLAAMGVSPVTEVKVSDVSGRRLPKGLDKPTVALIETALARRPDVLAAFARMQASEAGVRAAEAAFRPKVYLSAVAAAGQGTMSVGGLPGLNQQATASGVMVGISIPLYQGGLRKAQREAAQSASNVAQETLTQTQDAAAREIVIASDTLRTALAAYEAAGALRKAAAVTYDAALESYRSGVGNVTDAVAANSGLLDASEAVADAHAAALVAASTLAFALGAMTSPDAPARAPR